MPGTMVICNSALSLVWLHGSGVGFAIGVGATGVGCAMREGLAAAAGEVSKAAAAGGTGEVPVHLDGWALVHGRLVSLSFMGTTLSLGGRMVFKKKSKAGNLMASKMWDEMW